MFFIVFEWAELRKVQWINSNAVLRRNYFPVNVSVLTVVFLQQISKNKQFCLKLSIFWRFVANITTSTETFTEKKLGHNSALYITSYLSIALSKILPCSNTIKALRNCRYLVKATLVVYLIFYKLMFFETLKLWSYF